MERWADGQDERPGRALSDVAWSRLAGLDDAGRLAVVTRIVVASCAGVLGIRRDAVDVDRPLDALGFDRRMLVGVHAEVGVMLGTDLPSPDLLGPRTIREVAADLDLQVGDGLAAGRPADVRPSRCAGGVGAGGWRGRAGHRGRPGWRDSA